MIDNNKKRMCHWGPSQFDECWNMEIAYLTDRQTHNLEEFND